MMYIYISIVVSFFALIFAGILAWRIQKQKTEDEKAKKFSQLIRKGAITFLNKEYKILIVFVLIIGIILYFLLNHNLAWAFLLGVIFSALAGNLGMRVAVISNIRVVETTKKSLKSALLLAFNSGSVMGMTVVGLGLLGISVLYLIFEDPQIIYGFGLGASIVALFARVSGGIYAKSADIGADFAGKFEVDISEDDSQNPAVIADNIGDNVNDIAGAGADLFESYVDAIISTMVIGGLLLLTGFQNLIYLPLLLATAGIIAAIIGNITFDTKHFLQNSKLNIKYKKIKPCRILKQKVFKTAILVAIISLFVIKFTTGQFILFWPFLIGLVSGIGISLITEFYTSHDYGPTRELAISAQTGSATSILKGLSLGIKSSIGPTLIILAVIFLAYLFSGIYAVAIATIGMLSIMAIVLAVSSAGPVIDNASGIIEMAKIGEETKKKIGKLDAIGNTTATIGKNFAMGVSALTMLVLLISYSLIVDLKVINILMPKIIIGLFLGGLAPFLFSSFTISSINRATIKIIQEIRKQFEKNHGLLEGKTKPDYSRCVIISTRAALKRMPILGVSIIVLPIFVGILLGPEALGGLLVGSTLTGFLLAIIMANSGASWDNAKKYIEAGNLGGKGSKAHKSAIIGDVIGDSFKDATGPSLNILLKLMAITALIIGPLL